MLGNFKVVTLCGSTKFKNEFIKVQQDLTLKGYIVLSLNIFTHSNGKELTNEDILMLSKMHMEKINISDEIFVIDVDGYIGTATRNEISYAIQRNIPIKYYSKSY